MDKIRILIADDSDTSRRMLKMLFESDPELVVAGEAANGLQAVQLASSIAPDIITMDIHMPVMDGYEAIEKIMASAPAPIVVITSSFHGKSSRQAFEAMSKGALDVLKKPDLSAALKPGGEARELNEKIKIFAKTSVKKTPAAPSSQTHSSISDILQRTAPAPRGKYDIIAIASSTGGPKALGTILAELPADFPVGIVIVQHIAAGFDAGMVEWLDKTCRLHVRMAAVNDTVTPGIALICPTQYHMTIPMRNSVRLVPDPPFRGFRPAGDVLFPTVADTYAHRAIGVILTGMGCDGAEGLRKMKLAGAYTIAQDEASCVVYGMPKAAAELGAAVEVTPLAAIARSLISLTKG